MVVMTWSKLSMNFPQLRRFDLVKTILSKKKKNIVKTVSYHLSSKINNDLSSQIK